MSTSISINIQPNMETTRSSHQRGSVSQTEKHEKGVVSKKSEKIVHFDAEYEAVKTAAEGEIAPTQLPDRRRTDTEIADERANPVPETVSEGAGALNFDLIVPQYKDASVPEVIVGMMPGTGSAPLPMASPPPARANGDVQPLAPKLEPAEVENIHPLAKPTVAVESTAPGKPIVAEFGQPLRQVVSPRFDRALVAAQGSNTPPVEVLSMRTHVAAAGPAQTFANDLSAIAPVILPALQGRGESGAKASVNLNPESTEIKLENDVATSTSPITTPVSNSRQQNAGDHSGTPSDERFASDKRSADRSRTEVNIQNSGLAVGQAMTTAPFEAQTALVGNEVPGAQAGHIEPAKLQTAIAHSRPDIVRNIEVVIDPGEHGSLGLQMTMNSEGLDLRVETSSSETAQLLDGDADGLHSSLLRSGVDVSSVNVFVNKDLTTPLPAALHSSDGRSSPGQPSSEASLSNSSGNQSRSQGGGQEAGAWKGRQNQQEPLANTNANATVRTVPIGGRTLFV